MTWEAFGVAVLAIIGGVGFVMAFIARILIILRWPIVVIVVALIFLEYAPDFIAAINGGAENQSH